MTGGSIGKSPMKSLGSDKWPPGKSHIKVTKVTKVTKGTKCIIDVKFDRLAS